MNSPANTEPVGLYIHIPFCRAKCPYCDFYSIPFSEDTADAYAASLLRAMETQPFGKLRVDSLYLGGGTPSLMGAGRLDKLLQKAAILFGLDSGSEITLEANPDSVSPDLLSVLRGCGYNRVSFGVQSSREEELRALGRLHTSGQARAAIMAAHAAGFENISADLMLGVPFQSLKSLDQSISFLTGLPVRHISAYLLKTEPSTAFYQRRDRLSLPDEDGEAALYLDCVKRLQNAGFEQYEISNFAKEGYSCRHNLKYWQCRPYLGLGPAAHSFLGNTRYSFGRDLDSFLGADDVFSLLQTEGEGGGVDEQLLLRLRLREGFDTRLLEPYGSDPLPLLKKARALSANGLCSVQDGVISLSAKGFLLSNPVTVTLLDALGK